MQLVAVQARIHQVSLQFNFNHVLEEIVRFGDFASSGELVGATWCGRGERRVTKGRILEGVKFN